MENSLYHSYIMFILSTDDRYLFKYLKEGERGRKRGEGEDEPNERTVVDRSEGALRHGSFLPILLKG